MKLIAFIRKPSVLIALSLLLAIAYVNFAGASSWQGSRVGENLAQDSSVFPAISSGAYAVTEQIFFSGEGLLYGIHLASHSTPGNFVVLRDSGSTSGLFGYLTIPIMSSITHRIVQFNPPLRIYQGLTGSASGCEDRTGAAEHCYTLVYDVLP